MMKPSINLFSSNNPFTVPNTVERSRNSCISLNRHEIPLIRNEHSDILIGSKNRTNKLTQNRIFPLADRRVYKNLTRNRIDDRFNRPVPLTTRASVPLRTSGFADIHDQERESFHCSMGPILAVAQFFGILPLAGVNSKSPRSLVFKIYDPRTIYAFLILLLFVLMVVDSVCTVISSYDPDAVKLHANGPFCTGFWALLFYSVTTLDSIFFIWLAAHWKKIQEQWRAMEQLLDRGKHEPTRLRSKFTVITSFIVIHSFLQYVMSLLSGAPLDMILSGSNVTFSNVFHAICSSYHPYLLKIVDYNLAVGIAIVTIISVATVGWNFMDLFVLLISCGLAERYKSLNKHLQHGISKRPGRIVWSEFRERYATLSKLVKNVDHHISPIILLLFFTDIYSACLKLLVVIKGNSVSWHRVYYFVSFLFEFIPTSAVTMLAAQVNIQSKNALPDIYLCPESAYNSEAQRLQQQLSLDHVYLTGMKFFPITRNIMMAILGTMVTYEVLLLNINSL